MTDKKVLRLDARPTAALTQYLTRWDVEVGKYIRHPACLVPAAFDLDLPVPTAVFCPAPNPTIAADDYLGPESRRQVGSRTTVFTINRTIEFALNLTRLLI